MDPKKLNEKPTDDGGENTPEYMTAEQFNKAFSARMEAERKKTMSAFQEMLAPIAEKLNGAGGPPNTQTDPAKKVEDDRISNLEKMLEAERKRNKANEEKAAAQEAAARKAARQNMLQQALVKAGVTNPTFVKSATMLLEGSINHKEDGSIVFKKPNGYGTEDDVEVDTFIQEWTKTDEGKSFLPPRQGKGSGNVPGRSSGGSGSGKQDEKMTGVEAMNTVIDFMMRGGSGE